MYARRRREMSRGNDLWIGTRWSLMTIYSKMCRGRDTVKGAEPVGQVGSAF